MNDSRPRQRYRVEVQWAGGGKSTLTGQTMANIAKFTESLDAKCIEDLGLEGITITKEPDKEDDGDNLSIPLSALRHVGSESTREYWGSTEQH